MSDCEERKEKKRREGPYGEGEDKKRMKGRVEGGWVGSDCCVSLAQMCDLSSLLGVITFHEVHINHLIRNHCTTSSSS